LPALAFLLICQVGVLVSIAHRTGVTIDEPAHLLSAHLYWKGQDTLYPGDMPPAIKIVGGWVSHLFPLPVPYDKEAWKRQIEWDLALTMMQRMEAPLLQDIFFYSRLPLIVFPLLTCLTLWLWARRLFSAQTAILLALMFCLSPTVLAHGALFKNDLAASFGFLFFWYRTWMFWKFPSRSNSAWMGAALLAAVLAKLSLLILVPLAPIVIVARHFGRGRRSWSTLAQHLILLALVPYAGAAAAWQFRMDVVTEQDIRKWQENKQIPGWIPAAAHVLHYIPTPTRLRNGTISLVESNSDGVGVYLLGKVYSEGHPLYFLVALATKAPSPFLFLLVVATGLIAVDLARRRTRLTDWFWIVPPLLYIVMASMSSLQLGIRLILPGMVGLFLWCGRPIELFWRRRATVALLMLLLAWRAGRTVYQYPHYIAYFNTLAGGSNAGINYLSDSNLDWGQDLPALAEYIEEHHVSKIHLAYFGMDNPHAYIPKERFDQLIPPWNEKSVEAQQLDPEPGYYAISATLLTGQLFAPAYRDYFAAFRESEPIGKAGYSIFIYEVR
jgi:hypothetical protein